MLEKIRSLFRFDRIGGEEEKGIKKYLNSRNAAGFGSALLLIVICVAIAVVSSVTTESCSRSGTTGTWVLREDYYNGFDQGDRYVEFRKDGSFFVNGEKKGYLVIDGKKRGISTIPNMSYLNSSADKIRLENNLLIIEAQSNRLYDMPSADAWRMQVYVRISRDVELTPEHRAELY